MMCKWSCVLDGQKGEDIQNDCLMFNQAISSSTRKINSVGVGLFMVIKMRLNIWLE